MKKIMLLLLFIQGVSISTVYAQTIYVHYEEELQDTVYTWNGNGFLYDHTGTGNTQLLGECIGLNECRLYFRFNGKYPFITNYSKGYATTMNTLYKFNIRNWNYDRIPPYNSIVYTFDIPISKSALKAFWKTDILRFKIGNYLFTATDNIQYGLGRLYSRTKRTTSNTKENNVKSLHNITGNKSKKTPSKLFNKIEDFEFGLVKVKKMERGNFLFVHILLNANDKVTVFAPIEDYLKDHPKFNPITHNGKILSYLNCDVLPEDGLIDDSGNINTDKKWALPTDIATTTDGDSLIYISDFGADSTTFHPSTDSDSGQNIISLAFIVPEKHIRCDINFLGTSSNMDSLLIKFEN